jgi:hypothetical protein
VLPLSGLWTCSLLTVNAGTTAAERPDSNPDSHHGGRGRTEWGGWNGRYSIPLLCGPSGAGQHIATQDGRPFT